MNSLYAVNVETTLNKMRSLFTATNYKSLIHQANIYFQIHSLV